MKEIDFISYMKIEHEDSIYNYMSNSGYKLYKIDGNKIGSIEEFFAWVRAEFPQDPPLPDRCNFNALIDSLWGGFDTLGEEKVAVIWSNPAKLMNADKQSFEVLIDCFRELSEALLEGDYGMNQPVCLKTIFLD